MKVSELVAEKLANPAFRREYEHLVLSSTTDSLALKRMVMRLPVKERRAILAEQSRELAEYYDSNRTEHELQHPERLTVESGYGERWWWLLIPLAMGLAMGVGVLVVSLLQ